MSISKRAQILFEDAFQAQENIFRYLQDLNKQGIYVLNQQQSDELKKIIADANSHYDNLYEYLINDANAITLRGPIFPINHGMEHIEYIISNLRNSIREANRIVTRDFFRLQ
jgi:hypothetical protein